MKYKNLFLLTGASSNGEIKSREITESELEQLFG